MKKSLLVLISISGLCVLSACGGGSPPPATHFSLTAPASATAGTAFNFTVTALDASNRMTTNYSGTAHFTSTDGQAVLPANSMLKNGMGTFSATLKTVGSQSIMATDTVTASITGTSSSINVAPGTASHFSVTAPGTANVGVAFNFTVTALDAFGNRAATYTGTVHFTSTDGQAVLPANSSLTNGTATFSATLKTIGGQTINATDTVTASITGTSNVIMVFTRCQGAGQPCYPGHPCCSGLACVKEGTRAFCIHIPLGPESRASEEVSRFTATCSMEAGRESHTATLLSNRLVLITGGDRTVSLATAELFNPESHSFAPAGDMANARTRHTATLLANGAVLLVGGRDASGNALATAELFNPANVSFAPTGRMTTARESHTATLLSDGKVLITGGLDGTAVLATAELFNPTTGSFTAADSMGAARGFQTATLLKNGKVLVTGGRDADGHVVATAELFDPTRGAFAPTGAMHTAREFHTATLLSDGKVLITGGDNGTESLATAELFDPTSGSFTATGSMEAAREFHTATLRNDGTVLVAGGTDFTSVVAGNAQGEFVPESAATAELFNPASGSFAPTSNMGNARARHTAILLPTGEVLVTGGINTSGDTNSLTTAELFQ
jgi:hypothetical protein